MTVLIALLAAALGARQGAAQGSNAQVTREDLLRADPSNWLSYSGAYHSQRHSALKQIHSGNVWTLPPKRISQIPVASRLEAIPLESAAGPVALY